MGKMNLSGFFTVTNLKRVAALLMAILMLVCIVGCTGEEEGGSSSAASSSSQQDTSSDASSDTSSDVSSDDATSSENSDSAQTGTTGGSTKVDPLDGDITVNYEYQAGTSKTDANELKLAEDPVLIYLKEQFGSFKGYAWDEREELRKEILNTKNTLELKDSKGEQLYKPKGRVFYVSTKGSDSNDGTSPEKAIQSLAAIDGLLLKDGDTVLFERGCVWRMIERFECTEGVTYGSYGKGDKPVILGSPKNFAQEVWKPSKKKNVWQINYMYDYPAGCFINNGQYAGYQKLTLRELEKNTDFFCDEETATLYLYCDKGNPSNVWDYIEFSQQRMCMFVSTGVDRVTVDNLCLRYLGAGGVGTLYNNEELVVTNCEIGFTGGAWIGNNPGGGGVRLGNGIGSWCGGLNYKWDHNWVYQTFDSGVSPQGNVGNHNYDNISISDNLFELNNCDIESWESSDGTNGKGKTTYSNNHYDRNICRFTSLGWGTRIDDGGIRGIDGVHYGHFREKQVISLTFNDNIIDCPGRACYKFTMADKWSYDNWERKGNVYYIKQGIRTLNQLTFQFHWIDDQTRVPSHNANDKKSTLAAFAEFEPDATVHWYK